MSKILRFLYYFLSITFLTVAILAIKTEPVFAAQDDFEIKQTPDPVTTDDGEITLTIKRRGDQDFFQAPEYSMVAWIGDLDKFPPNKCRVTNRNMGGFDYYVTAELTVTKSEITARWNRTLSGCNRDPGTTWHFKLWAGTSWDANKIPGNVIIDDYPVTVVQQGGRLVTLMAKNPTVYANQQPIVIISNAPVGGEYTFWWNGDKVRPVFSKRIDEPNSTEFTITEFTNTPSPRNLCMEYGSFPGIPLGNDCNPFVQFWFKTGELPPPPTQITCTIMPSNNLPLGHDVKIKIGNVSTGTIVSAYAIDSSGKQWPTTQGISDSTISVVLTLINRAPAGSYTAVAYTNSNPSENICPNTTFVVSSNTAPPAPSATPCTGKDCTKAGGDPCDTGDGRGPGIKTAIGCIHTNPAELVKDLMTFVVGIGGGLAFLMMLLGAFQMLTSAGNPETLNAGKDRLTSAVIGLLFVIFAVLLLQIIGVGILNLPGFKP